MTSVAAVVVTRDRRDLLRACLGGVQAQTRRLDRIIVVDNASSDGTPAIVRDDFPEAELVGLTENVGSSGGFHVGLERARETEAEWFWLLDDDTIPRPDALERLLAAPWRQGGLPEPLLLASRVDWIDGHPHPMNTPILRRRDPQALVDAAAVGLLALRASTFVSLLVAREAIDLYGLPRAEFFFQADDIEFTARMLRTAPGYLVPDSIVEHRTGTPRTFLDDPVRFYHHLRNTVWMIRGQAWSRPEKAALGWVVLNSSLRFLRSQRWGVSGLRTVARALGDGLTRF